MKSYEPKTINGVTYKRVEFASIQAGDKLYQMLSENGGTPKLIGCAINAERKTYGTTAVELDNGKRLTRRGWQNKRLWKIA